MVWRVDVLAYDGCFAAELYGIVDMLTVANAVSVARGAAPLFGTVVRSVTGTVRLSGGGELRTALLGRAARDELVVPGFECVDPTTVDASLAGWTAEVRYLRAARARAGPLSAVCGGTFLLAEAGLLDGHAATTSWLFAPELARRHPLVDVRSTAMVLHDGRFSTAGAFSAAYDLALDVVRRHGGDPLARAVSAVTLVSDSRRSQAPYVDDALLPVPPASFADDVKRRLRGQLHERYDLSALAAAFHVSTRTLLRRFAAATGGRSPLSYLQGVRVSTAKRLLETSELSIAEITAQVGYADAATFRRLFVAATSVTPSDYRRRFAGAGPTAVDAGLRREPPQDPAKRVWKKAGG
jgi:transcriptional regulator GlxA family with amidase domain